jgi:hypothetical protein
VTIAEALARAGTGFTVAGSFAHGEVGATLIRDERGAEAVAKWFSPATPADVRALRSAIELVDQLREHGGRVPIYLDVAELRGGALVLQERLPGTSSRVAGAPLIADLLAHNARQAGLAPDGRGWTAYVRRSLRDGLDGYCEHGSLAGHSAATRELLTRVREAGAGLVSAALEEHDAVHLDFHHLNVLQRDGRLTGVVDGEGMRSGDRIFDLVTLAVCLVEAECPALAAEQVWDTVLAARDRVTLTAYVAHMALRQVDWSIRHRTGADVARWLAQANAALARVG